MSFYLADWAVSVLETYSGVTDASAEDCASAVDALIVSLSCTPTKSSSASERKAWLRYITSGSHHQGKIMSTEIRSELLLHMVKILPANEMSESASSVIQFILSELRSDGLEMIQIRLLNTLALLVEGKLVESVLIENFPSINSRISNILRRSCESQKSDDLIIGTLDCFSALLESFPTMMRPYCSYFKDGAAWLIESENKDLQCAVGNVLTLITQNNSVKTTFSISFSRYLLEAHLLLETSWPDSGINMGTFSNSVLSMEKSLENVNLRPFFSSLLTEIPSISSHIISKILSRRFRGFCILIDCMISRSASEHTEVLPLNLLIALIERVTRILPRVWSMERSAAVLPPKQGGVSPAMMQIALVDIMKSTVLVLNALSSLPRAALLQIGNRFGRVLVSFMDQCPKNEELYVCMCDALCRAVTAMGSASTKGIVTVILPRFLNDSQKTIEKYSSADVTNRRSYTDAELLQNNNRSKGRNRNAMAKNRMKIENTDSSKMGSFDFSEYDCSTIDVLCAAILSSGQYLPAKLLQMIENIAISGLSMLSSPQNRPKENNITVRLLRLSKLCLLMPNSNGTRNGTLLAVSGRTFRMLERESSFEVSLVAKECLLALNAILHPRMPALRNSNMIDAPIESKYEYLVEETNDDSESEQDGHFEKSSSTDRNSALFAEQSEDISEIQNSKYIGNISNSVSTMFIEDNVKPKIPDDNAEKRAASSEELRETDNKKWKATDDGKDNLSDEKIASEIDKICEELEHDSPTISKFYPPQSKDSIALSNERNLSSNDEIFMISTKKSDDEDSDGDFPLVIDTDPDSIEDS